MSDVQQQPAPGWYPDAVGAMRWWDGQQWGGYAPPAVTVQRAPGNGAAVASLVLGILGVSTGWMIFAWFFVVPMAIVGVVFGVVGVRRAREINGRGAAVALWGIVLSGLPLLMVAVGAVLAIVNR